jgi:hypothetical protein
MIIRERAKPDLFASRVTRRGNFSAVVKMFSVVIVHTRHALLNANIFCLSKHDRRISLDSISDRGCTDACIFCGVDRTFQVADCLSNDAAWLRHRAGNQDDRMIVDM